MVLDLFEYLPCKYDNGSSAISNFGILRARNVCEDASSGMNNVKELYSVSFGPREVLDLVRPS